MSIIGLLDWDLTQWKQPTVFNLELMKLSYYHKIKQHDIIQMEKTFASEMCTKVYIQKDYEDFMYPDNIVNDPKVLWRGMALSNNIYCAMNEDIEECPADTSIYTNFEKFYTRSYDYKQIFTNMMNGTHLRLSIDNQQIFNRWDNQMPDKSSTIKHFIFHDKNLANIRGAANIVKNLINFYGKNYVKIGFKFPLEIYDIDTLAAWSGFNKSIHLNNMNVHFQIPNESLFKLVSCAQQLTYYFDSINYSEEKLFTLLPNIFLQGMFLSRCNVALLLKLDNNLAQNSDLNKLSSFLSAYFTNCTRYRESLVFSAFTYMKYCYHRLNQEEKKILFTYVKNNSDELFDYLYSVEYVDIKQNTLIPHMYTINEFSKGGGAGGKTYQYRNKGQNNAEQQNYSEFVQSCDIYLE